VRVITFSSFGEPPRIGGVEQIEQYEDASDAWIWIDVEGDIEPSLSSRLLARFGVQALAIQDAYRPRHPPKLELFANHAFLLLRDVHRSKNRIDPKYLQLSLFIGKRVLITMHAKESSNLDSVFQALSDGTLVPVSGGTNVHYRILRNIVDNYSPIVADSEEQLDSIEDAIFETPEDASIERLSRLNRVLRRLRRILAYQAQVVDQYRKQRELDVPMNLHEVTDIFENLDRLASLCQLNQELAVDLLNTHLSVASHRLNVVMRVLTIATIVFLPLGLLAGIYGMNFEVMPELSWRYGYFTVLGTMASVVVALVAFFKIKRWL